MNNNYEITHRQKRASLLIYPSTKYVQSAPCPLPASTRFSAVSSLSPLSTVLLAEGRHRLRRARSTEICITKSVCVVIKFCQPIVSGVGREFRLNRSWTSTVSGTPCTPLHRGWMWTDSPTNLPQTRMASPLPPSCRWNGHMLVWVVRLRVDFVGPSIEGC